MRKLIYMDEVGTPDSSRIWDGPAYKLGQVVENSKEGFRKMLQAHFPDPDILLNKDRMDERYAPTAAHHRARTRYATACVCTPRSCESVPCVWGVQVRPLPRQ